MLRPVVGHGFDLPFSVTAPRKITETIALKPVVGVRPSSSSIGGLMTACNADFFAV
jgi:hypothetical protein